MRCPHCKQEMPEQLASLPKLTVDTLEDVAGRTMERDEFGIGRGSWTSTDNVTFTVSIREGEDFAYRLTMPLGMVAPVDREEFAARLEAAQ